MAKQKDTQDDVSPATATATTGASEQTLIAARKAKAARIRERGEDPFTNDIDPKSITPLGAIREHFASALGEEDKYDSDKVAQLAATAPWGEAVTVAGRVVASRSFGKVQFLRARDWAGEIQLFCRKNVLGEDFARLTDIDVADHVTATGRIMVTKTGELSIEATALRLLTKAFRPLPDKWAGLSDVEVRYRRRYVDLVANAEARSIFRARTFVVRALRSYLDERGFLEVETPTMNSLVGGAAAKPFTTHHNALDMELFMRIAPELYLKRLVVGGFERVYEIARCYRNEGLSTRHNPEFTMLEFYMAYATYETLMDMTEEMFRYVDAYLQKAMPEQHAAWCEQRLFRLDVPFERRTMRDLLAMRLSPDAETPDTQAGKDLAAFRDQAGLNVAALTDAAALEQVGERGQGSEVRLSSAIKKQLSNCENHGERIFLLYELLVEPDLPVLFTSGGKSLPVFVTDHPVEVSPLARRQTRKGGDPTLVDRFELFVHGRELCNAFSELNDPEDQAARFLAQVEKKNRGADETMDYDEDYIRALEHGLPPTAGFGVGVDRLTMALTAQDSIREVILFPLLRPER
jgi:lysyl-tRNA synthetase, class II